MVNIQPTSTQNNWKNYAIIGGTSLGAGAIYGTARYKFGDDACCWKDKGSSLRDSFERSLEEALTRVKDKKTLEVVERQKNIEAGIDKLSSTSELKDYITKNLKYLKENKLICEIIDDCATEKDLNKMKDGIKVCHKMFGEYAQHFKDVASSCWDKTTKTFVNKDNKLSKQAFAAISAAAKSERIIESVKWGTGTAMLGGAVAGIMLWLVNKFSDKT